MGWGGVRLLTLVGLSICSSPGTKCRRPRKNWSHRDKPGWPTTDSNSKDSISKNSPGAWRKSKIIDQLVQEIGALESNKIGQKMGWICWSSCKTAISYVYSLSEMSLHIQWIAQLSTSLWNNKGVRNGWVMAPLHGAWHNEPNIQGWIISFCLIFQIFA